MSGPFRKLSRLDLISAAAAGGKLRKKLAACGDALARFIDGRSDQSNLLPDLPNGFLRVLAHVPSMIFHGDLLTAQDTLFPKQGHNTR